MLARASLVGVALLFSCAWSRSARADEPVLTPAAQPVVAAAFARVVPPCGAALRSVRIDRSRITLVYERPAFEVTVVHPEATAAGHRVGPYRLLDATGSACPGAAGDLARGLAEQTLRDPWQPARRQDDPRTANRLPAGALSVAGALLVAVHLILILAMVRVATVRGNGSARDRAWRAAPLVVAAAGIVARACVPAVVFNWYSTTPASDEGFVALAQGVVGMQRLAIAWGVPGTGFAHVTAVVCASGGVAAGLAVLVAERVGLPRPVALLTGLLMALWPALVRMGASDAPHPLALTLWLSCCLLWDRARAGRPSAAALLVVPAALLPMVRAEACVWLPAIAVLFPPRRATPRVAWLGLGAAAAAAAALALVPLRENASVSLGSPLAWLVLPFRAGRGLSAAPLALDACVLLGVAMLARDARALALRWIGCGLVVAAPALLGDHGHVDPLTLRYFLPLAFLAALAVARAIRGLAHALAPRRPWVAGLAALLPCAVEARGWLDGDRQYVFRREAAFLRAVLAPTAPDGRPASAPGPLPSDARLCMLDPAVNQEWSGPHRDFDSAWSPRGGGAYLGLGERLVRLGTGPGEGPPPCAFYYESAACSFEPGDARFRPDLDRVLSLCAAWRARTAVAARVEQPVAAIPYGARFAADAGEVWLRVFPMR
jgi:hypothetical protein